MVPRFSCSAHDHGHLDLAHDLGIYPTKHGFRMSALPKPEDVFFCMSTETHIMCRGICISIIIYIHVYIIYLYYLFKIYIYIVLYLYNIIYIVLIVFCQHVPLLFRCFSPLFPRPSYKVSQAAGFFDHWTMATWIVTLSFTSKSLITLLGRTQHFKSVLTYI